jgi:hypothetical protein
MHNLLYYFRYFHRLSGNAHYISRARGFRLCFAFSFTLNDDASATNFPANTANSDQAEHRYQTPDTVNAHGPTRLTP